jgi:hypothetical protein
MLQGALRHPPPINKAAGLWLLLAGMVPRFGVVLLFRFPLPLRSRGGRVGLAAERAVSALGALMVSTHKQASVVDNDVR